MFRTYLTAALRALARDKLHTAINLFGLSTACCSALLIFLYVRQELRFDAWLPDARSTYLLIGGFTQPGRPPIKGAAVPADFAGKMKTDFSDIDTIARLRMSGVSVRRGAVETSPDHFFWADPEIFSLLKFPAVAGDLETALQRPDGIVITRSMARKYFGSDAPLGGILVLDRTHEMKVAAVIEDLPSNSNMPIDVIASGRASFSQLTEFDARPPCPECYTGDVYTYLRLKRGASLQRLKQEMPAFFNRHKRPPDIGLKYQFSVLPLTQLHLTPGLTGIDGIGDAGMLRAMSSIGGLILLIAGINFVNLMTARAARRATEVGIRKVSGASRRALITQFIGELLAYVTASFIVAVALSELLLPHLNSLVDRKLGFDYWHQPSLVLTMFAAVALIGILAGLYPAFVLSAFRPREVLRNAALRNPGVSSVRHTLVVVQFAALIVLIVATGLVYRQTVYALREAMRLDIDQVVLVDDACPGAFQQQVALLPGVKAAACSGYGALNFGELNAALLARDGRQVNIAQAPVDVGFFELYGIEPMAGRVFSSDREDNVAARTTTSAQASFVVNETAARRLGYLSSSEAIGKTTSRQEGEGKLLIEIIGVVPDFSVDAIHKPVAPTAYFVDKAQLGVLSVKLSGHDIPETLNAIDRLWNRVGEAKHPVDRRFLEQHVRGLYMDVTRQLQLLTVFSGIALVIACLGLFGLAAFTAERRTKEIGIRKAMGAGTGEVMQLLTWQFVKPVLWANLIAWPVAGFAMNRWLNGFAYHVDLDPRLFVAATAAALLITLLTVSVHCYLVARAKPVAALRYE